MYIVDIYSCSCQFLFLVGFARCTSSTIVFHWTLEVEFCFGFSFGVLCRSQVDLMVYLADMVCLWGVGCVLP